MAERIPLILKDGRIEEIPSADTIPASNLPGAISLFQYRVAVTTDPATITLGAFRTVPLATTVLNEIVGVSLASNIVTIPAGTFLLEYWVSAWKETVPTTAVTTQCHIFDNDASLEVVGSGGSVIDTKVVIGNDSINHTGKSIGEVQITPGSETDYLLRVRTSVDVVYAEQSPWTSQVVASLRIKKIG